MAITVKLRYLRIAPRKVRLVVDLIRGKKAIEAQTLLRFLPKRASLPIDKLLKSAIDSAKNNFQLEEGNLYISKITVDEGPKLKRWQPRARGQAYEIQKKTSHIIIVLDEFETKPKKAKKPKFRTKSKPDAGLVRHRKEISGAGKAEVIKEKVEKDEKASKIEKPRLRTEIKAVRPKTERGIRRIFRRKAF
ncbi:MAG TPA: 50S ribosomal protein L22 [Candidatus Nealsonbacteria bacterium]|uniref:50S ribosomal protein L22 n=1 Tax=marine sediment metagenome TaxID=412755 RepID=A0A0F9UK10_9ZZZZ|nr:50S ribosomal protein L22 [Candidatus Nealsonbacteria bacterium]HEB46359.1 50S ribosomal protein L22 [Candidatus Nealsonbacteria bacterium]